MHETSNALHIVALQKFKKNFWGVFSFWFVVVCAFVAIFAYLIAPDSSRFANQMQLSIHSRTPGFNVQMLAIPEVNPQPQSFLDRIFFGDRNAPLEIPISNYSFENNVLKIIPYTEKGLTSLPKVIANDRFSEKLTQEVLTNKYITNRRFLLGTDKYGRDLLSRMLIGIRISFSIGFVAVLISLLLGITLGAVAGYFGGKVDAVIMWLINVTWSIPTLLLVIAISLALGKGFWQVFIAVGLTMWVEVARIVRGQVISIKQMQYITAARALGYAHPRIILKHILPNSLAPVIVISAANFAAAILIESGLSFLGIGAQPPMPSWGAMIKDHYSYIILGKAYLAVIPGLAIMSLVMSFMLIGNALRDALDVKN